MGGVPPSLHSHAQQVKIIGVGSLTGSEIDFVCTNFSAIRTIVKIWYCETAMNSKMKILGKMSK